MAETIKTKIQIKSFWGSVLYESEKETVKEALQDAVLQGAVLQDAVLQGADLQDADLQGAVLQGAVLQGAVLRGAVLRGADLRGADLQDAVLQGADLRDADLRDAVLQGAVLQDAVLQGAVLRGAVLRGADLRDADLRDADLQGAVLQGAVLQGAVLRGAVLRETKADLFLILLENKNEVAGLMTALKEGRVDGSVYNGECACLIGTIANLKKCSADDLPQDVNRPAESWFLGIKKGDTPETNQISKITVEWIEEFQKLMEVQKHA